MTDKFKEIEERWAGATPGPWSVRDSSKLGSWPRVIESAPGHANIGSAYDDDKHLDATAIAHAPEDVAWLLKRVRELEEGLEGIRLCAVRAWGADYELSARLMAEKARALLKNE